MSEVPDQQDSGGGEGASGRIPELTQLATLLRQARLERGLSLAELADQLHMGPEQLQALEAADPLALPEKVFVIAQARRIAAALGLDVADQIAALRGCAGLASSAPVLNASDVFKPAPRQRGALIGASGVLVVVAVVLAGLWSQRALLQSQWASLQRQLLPVSKPAVVATTKRAPAPVTTQLLVRANAVSWLEVRSLPSNKPLFRGMFQGQRRFPLGMGLELRAGRPNAITVAVGSSVPRTLGTVKDLRWFSFRPVPVPLPPQP